MSPNPPVVTPEIINYQNDTSIFDSLIDSIPLVLNVIVLIFICWLLIRLFMWLSKKKKP